MSKKLIWFRCSFCNDEHDTRDVKNYVKAGLIKGTDFIFESYINEFGNLICKKYTCHKCLTDYIRTTNKNINTNKNIKQTAGGFSKCRTNK